MASAAPMIARSSPHVHTQFCDGRSTAEEIVQTALQKGFVSLGFSSHAKQDFDPKYSLDEAREADYITEIKRLQEKYQDQIKIWLGMEQDYYSTADKNQFEYVIGSVHYMQMPDGSKLAVDSSFEQLQQIITDAFTGDAYALVETYYQMVGEFVARTQPDIIGHFDLLTKYNRGKEPFDETHPRYVKAAQSAMQQALTGCDLMEINVGALARTGIKGPYPALPLLRAWRDLGGQVILASDCHLAKYLDSAYDAGIALMKEAGYKKAAMLGRHEELFEWHEVP